MFLAPTISIAKYFPTLRVLCRQLTEVGGYLVLLLLLLLSLPLSFSSRREPREGACPAHRPVADNASEKLRNTNGFNDILPYARVLQI